MQRNVFQMTESDDEERDQQGLHPDHRAPGDETAEPASDVQEVHGAPGEG